MHQTNETPMPEAYNTEKEKFRDVLNAYSCIIETLHDVGINPETASSKQGLAFLVDETKKRYEATWNEDITAYKSQTIQINTKEGRAGVTWFFAEKVSETYLELLREELKKAHEQGDRELEDKLTLFIKMASDNLEFKRKAHSFGKPISFGGVSRSFVPAWSKFIE